ncbi:MAG: peptidylprolyl isomerase [Bryobacteraceae bacterium]
MKNVAGIAAGLALFLYGCSPAGEEPKKPAAQALPEKAPELYRVQFETSKGAFVVEVNRAWAPHGADHFYDLVKTGYYDGNRFYRVVRNFVAQWGISGDPQQARLWSQTPIPDDPVRASNNKGAISYAKTGPSTRTTQVFINLKDNSAVLDKTGFAPFGKVVSGMEVVESLYSYGELAPRGGGPDPKLMEQQGNAYLETRFPRLDFVKKATVIAAP